MVAEFITVTPVLPSQNIERDIAWYKEKTGFVPYFYDRMYGVIHRENLHIHLQWHADTEDDPLLGGSVIRIFVKNIRPLFDEYVSRGTVSKDKLRFNTPWKTNEFGFYDLNENAIFIVENAE
jgi:hypothetical protein